MNAPFDPAARGLARRAAAAAAAAQRIAALKGLRYRAMPSAATLPRITIALDNPTMGADADFLNRSNPRLTFAHSRMRQRGTSYPNDQFVVGAHISRGAPNAAYPIANTASLRFATDSPRIEFMLGGYSAQFVLLVDGQPVTPDTPTLAIPNIGNFHFVSVDFGADIQTVRPNFALSAGGSGYATGEVLSVVGGTGDPARLFAMNVDASGAIQRYGILDYGQYSALPGAPAATVSQGAGTGATFTLSPTSPLISRQRTRRVRRIELLGTGDAAFGGVRVTRNSLVRPWPCVGPRLMVMQDSYNETFQDYPGGAWAWRLARRLGIEDIWTNGVGGSGFTTSVGDGLRYGQRLGDLIANRPADPATPLILLTQGSINDIQAASDAALRDAAQTYWDAAFAAFPDAFMVQTGILRAPGNNPSDARSAALRAGFEAAQARFDPRGRRSGFIETRGSTGRSMMTVGGRAGATTGTGATDFWISGDAAHPTQDGQSFIGDVFAADLLELIAGWG